ncbi:hypothetical protein FOCC_FOCC006116 [Frankliniella occidentalis]|nr:hypothetical protein FOCC_FOCC006116 [Frankliniella occidentalis]
MQQAENVLMYIPNEFQTLATQSRHMPWGVQAAMSVLVRGMENFVTVTPAEFLFGYDDTLVTLANIANTLLHINWPAPRIMSLLKGRNGTLPEVHTMYTGHTSRARMGLLDRLNGLDHLPFWSEPPCNSIKASEGSFFPPRDITHEDIVAIYDKDLCRAFPLQYRGLVDKEGISAGYYTPPDTIFAPSADWPDNKCFCQPGESPTAPCELKGLQNISPCHYDAPVFVSFPHFWNADDSLLRAVEGLTPNRDLHETFFKIQPKLGVTMEAKVRIQLNLKVDHAPYIHSVHTFPEIVFPIIWLEEGVDELTPEIHRWVYIATTAADFIIPSVEYSFIVVGALTLAAVFVRTYKGVVFTAENLERGMEELRCGSHLLVNAASNAAHAASHAAHAASNHLHREHREHREQAYHLLRSTSTATQSSSSEADASEPATPSPAEGEEAERQPMVAPAAPCPALRASKGSKCTGQSLWIKSQSKLFMYYCSTLHLTSSFMNALFPIETDIKAVVKLAYETRQRKSLRKWMKKLCLSAQSLLPNYALIVTMCEENKLSTSKTHHAH